MRNSVVELRICFLLGMRNIKYSKEQYYLTVARTSVFDQRKLIKMRGAREGDIP